MASSGFSKTKKSVEDLIDLLRCSRCSSLSSADIFLSPCDHKHCESCLKAGGNCGICKRKLTRKDAIRDLLSGQILEKLLEFKDGLCSKEKQKGNMEKKMLDLCPTPLAQLTGNRRTKLSSEGSVKSSTSSATSSVGSPASLEKRNAKGETALHIAARNGKIERLEALIHAGANINAQDFAGWTPLHEAINGKSDTDNILQAVTLLCEAGCQVSAPGMANETPLHEASRLGVNSIISLLLSYGANKNARNKYGQTPRDVSKSEQVKLVIDNFTGPVTWRCEEINPVTLGADQKFVVYFTYVVKSDELDLFKTEFGAQITTEFSGDVTHVIFDTTELQPGEPVPLTLNYLMGLLSGAWLLSSKWLVDSLFGKRLLEPNNYEIQSLNQHVDDASGVRKRARTNRELGNPGLFQGINFYLYKNCSFEEMKKKDLAKLISIGDGVVINRDPNPDTVDPMENPTRFHAKDPSNKMILASHVILFSPESCPAKKHNMEHVKTLRVDWLIQSVLRFSLQDPDNFLP